MARRNWILSISTEHDNPLIFGPYTARRAKELRDRYNEIVDARTEEEQAGDWMHAGCYPIQNAGITEIRREFDL